MVLTPRLRIIADWVRDGAYLADVGTDHAYLPVWLRLNGKVSRAIASDLRKGPLERAKATAAHYGVDGIDFRLCDGLSAVSPQEADTIVLSGMGAETIIAILRAAPWALNAHTLLLQPQSHEELLRRFLSGNGCAIRREALVADRGTLYVVMEARGAGESAALTEREIWGGAKLLHDPLCDRYLIEKIVRLQVSVAGSSRSASQAQQARAETLRDAITALLQAREAWRHANGTGN
ncbi:MAG: SAM-dependent methyltransferase [Oscillibacter sp.]|nr:SAM-dependent methyltransferase [Oscillibacter sp.]